MIQVNISYDLMQLQRQIGAFEVSVLKRMQQAVEGAAIAVQKTAKTEIQKGSRSGRIYRRRTITHRASAPGEYPKTDTGRLVSSIRTDFGNFTAEVGSDVIYSEYLESGTQIMQPRPWLKRSFDTNARLIQQYMDDAVRDALK